LSRSLRPRAGSARPLDADRPAQHDAVGAASSRLGGAYCPGCDVASSCPGDRRPNLGGTTGGAPRRLPEGVRAAVYQTVGARRDVRRFRPNPVYPGGTAGSGGVQRSPHPRGGCVGSGNVPGHRRVVLCLRHPEPMARRSGRRPRGGLGDAVPPGGARCTARTARRGSHPGVAMYGMARRATPAPGLERAGWSRRAPLHSVVFGNRWPAGRGPSAPRSRLRAPTQAAIVAARDAADELLTVPSSLGVLDRALDRVVALGHSLGAPVGGVGGTGVRVAHWGGAGVGRGWGGHRARRSGYQRGRPARGAGRTGGGGAPCCWSAQPGTCPSRCPATPWAATLARPAAGRRGRGRCGPGMSTAVHRAAATRPHRPHPAVTATFLTSPAPPDPGVASGVGFTTTHGSLTYRG